MDKAKEREEDARECVADLKYLLARKAIASVDCGNWDRAERYLNYLAILLASERR